jgi:hypothetical protein
MNDAKRIEKDLLAELEAHGVVVTDLKRRQVREVAGDMALVERLRDQINQGAALDLDAFMKLKASAAASKAELLGSIPDDGTVRKIEVELVPSRYELADQDELRAENERLRQRLVALESGSPNGIEAATSAPPSVPDATPPPPSALAPQPPTNVVPLVETREQRIARLRHAAGDRPQTLRTAFELDHFPREGSGRFDFPTNRGGW